jgi:hypothetical protein
MLVALALTAGCGDDTKPKADAKPDGKKPPDGKIVDGGPSPEGILLPDGGKKPDQGSATGDCDPASIGKFCNDTTPCTKGWCLTLDSAGKSGVCTCDCTPDDSTTPLANEDSCPQPGAGFECSPDELEFTSGKKAHICLKRCAPKTGSNQCDPKLACDPISAVLYFGFDAYQTGYCSDVGCTADTDCPVLGPTKCDPAASTSSCASGEQCVKVSATEGQCAKPGKCDTASGLCTAHSAGKATAKIGDACKSDYDCGPTMTCFTEIDNSSKKKEGTTCTAGSECCSGKCSGGKCTKGLCTVDIRGGYCTTWGCSVENSWADKKCPTGSLCNLRYLAGFCQLSCDLTKAETCRGNPNDRYGDYECRAFQNLGYTTGPVCDFGTWARCNNFGTGLDCSFFGTDTDPKTQQTIEGNPTNMACRGLDGQVLADKASPIGYCLDDTGSGTQKRNPMPTP